MISRPRIVILAVVALVLAGVFVHRAASRALAQSPAQRTTIDTILE